MIENDTAAAAEFTQKTEPIDPYALSDGSKNSILSQNLKRVQFKIKILHMGFKFWVWTLYKA